MNERLKLCPVEVPMKAYNTNCPRCHKRLYQWGEDYPKCLACGYVLYEFEGPKAKVRSDKWSSVQEIALKRHPMYKNGKGIWKRRMEKQQRND